jgi:TRAP-type C4-dicarboxylate transport system permease small subunit
MGAVTDFGAAQPQAAAAALPEAPYTTWNIVSLSVCAVLLAVIGMFMYDLTRNMWSWDQATPVTSALMDMILGR